MSSLFSAIKQKIAAHSAALLAEIPFREDLSFWISIQRHFGSKNGILVDSFMHIFVKVLRKALDLCFCTMIAGLIFFIVVLEDAFDVVLPEIFCVCDSDTRLYGNALFWAQARAVLFKSRFQISQAITLMINWGSVQELLRCGSDAHTGSLEDEFRAGLAGLEINHTGRSSQSA